MTETGFVVYIVSFCGYGLLFPIGVTGGAEAYPHSFCMLTSHTRFRLNPGLPSARMFGAENAKNVRIESILNNESEAGTPNTPGTTCLAAFGYFS